MLLSEYLNLFKHDTRWQEGRLTRMAGTRNHIGEIALFAEMTEQERLAISRLCGWNKYVEGKEILHEDDPTTDVFFVAKGAVSAKSFSPGGKEVTYTEIESGNIFGEFSAIDNQLRSATVTTIEPSLIGRMNSRQFRLLLKQNPDLSLRFAAHLVTKIRSLSTRVYEFSTLNVRCRLHAELLRMCKQTGENTAIIDPAPIHYELATHIATHREAVSREISRLISIGIVRVDGRAIIICDLSRLQGLVDFSGD